MDFVALSAIDFIWNDILLNPMTNALIILSNVLFGNFGLAIIAFTLVTRFATYPLTLRQLRTTRAMQEMQPALKELQKKYKDPKRRQQEMMKLYREVGFNPLGCAVPFLIQIPIWVALFQVIRRTMGSTPEALFGLSDRLYNWSFITEAVPLDRNFLFLDLSNPSIPLAFLVAIATFYQQKFSMVRSTSTDDRQAATNRTLLYIMPLLFGWFTITVPSGLGLYWLITSLFGVGMAYFYNKPKNITWRWLISLEALPPRQTSGASAALPAVAEQSTDSSSAESRQPAGQTGGGKRRRRRRRRRSSRPPTAGTTGDGNG
jgi:YidC/Oxa1 family membrane protein insertase